ncbi:hypothetical protein CDD83_9156 [Cordyceps sp. RAO-2017]|nr:hypothetical protein CDD83_9156 [Cordyceps sp. RAO-2017]
MLPSWSVTNPSVLETGGHVPQPDAHPAHPTSGTTARDNNSVQGLTPNPLLLCLDSTTLLPTKQNTVTPDRGSMSGHCNVRDADHDASLQVIEISQGDEFRGPSAQGRLSARLVTSHQTFMHIPLWNQRQRVHQSSVDLPNRPLAALP